MSVHNAAMDIVSITSNMKEDGARWYMWGQSYGAGLADTVYRIAPDLYSGAILDGFRPRLIDWSKAHDLRKHIANNCKRNEQCRSLIDPEKIPKLAALLDKKDNKCTAYIDKKYGYFPEDPSIRTFVWRILRSSGSLSAQPKLVTLLHAAVECRDFEEWRKAVLTVDKEIESFSAVTTMKSVDISQSQAPEKTKVQESSSILLDLINNSERALLTRACVIHPEQFISKCTSAPASTRLNKEFAPYLYKPKIPPPYSRAINQIIVLAAKTDTQTLHDYAYDEFLAMNVRNKSFYSFDYAPHVSLGSTGGCERLILAQLLAANDTEIRSAQTLTKECVNHVNNFEFGWYDILEPELKALWDHSGTPPSPEEAPSVPEPQRTSSTSPPQETGTGDESSLFGVLRSFLSFRLASKEGIVVCSGLLAVGLIALVAFSVIRRRRLQRKQGSTRDAGTVQNKA